MQFLFNLNFLALLLVGFSTQFMNVASQGRTFRCPSIERPIPVCRLAKLDSIGYAYSVQVARPNQVQTGASFTYNCAGSSIFGYPSDNAACCDRYVNWMIAQIPSVLSITGPIFEEHCSRIGL